jgi:hypothetical protein
MTTTTSDDNYKNDAVTMSPITPCACGEGSESESESAVAVAAAEAVANNNADGVHVAQDVDSSHSPPPSTTCSTANNPSWIHPTSYDLYTHHILPTLGITRVEKRAGVLRYSLNHAWSKVRTRYKDALFLEFGVHEGKDMCRIAAFVKEKERQERSSSKKKGNKTNKASATTTNNAHTPTIVHGFDSFQGLPEAWDNGQRVQVEDATADTTDTKTINTKPAFDKGKFDLGGVVPVMELVQKQLGTSKFFSTDDKTDDDDQNSSNNGSCNVQLHAGWFHDTVSDFLDDQQLKLEQQQSNNTDTPLASSSSSQVKVAFVHADADLYSSTAHFLYEICRRYCLVPGSVLTFDEYANYEGWEQGECRAWMELSEQYGLEWKYLCYHGPRNNQVKWSHYGYQSVSVVITALRT